MMGHHILLLLLLHILPFSSQYTLVRRDPLAALGETLVTKQRHACDGDNLSLECPAGTKVSLQLVRYGRDTPSEQVCPPTPASPRAYTGREGLACTIPEAVRTVEELCQGKQSCSILTGVTTFGLHTFDPCPGVRKYVEVAYKCRPSSYNSRQLCGGSTLSFNCPRPSHHLAILTAQFQSAAAGPIYCPIQGPGQASSFMTDNASDAAEAAMKECEATQVTPSVVKLCHGRKQCSLTASPGFLGAELCAGLHVYLKVVFACIDSSVFLQKFVAKHLEENDRERMTEQERRFLPLPQSTIGTELSSNPTYEGGDIGQDSEGQETIITAWGDKDEDTVWWRVVSGFLQIQHVVKANPNRVALVLSLTMGVALCSALLCLVGRQCWVSSKRPPSPRDTPSHIDLDNDTIDYDLACRQLDPLPEPRLMIGGEGKEEWSLVSTLTRPREKKAVTRLGPLENYLGPSCDDNGLGHRYSTIGRARGRDTYGPNLTTPSPPPPCCQGDTPRALAPFHSHAPSDLYY